MTSNATISTITAALRATNQDDSLASQNDLDAELETGWGGIPCTDAQLAADYRPKTLDKVIQNAAKGIGARTANSYKSCIKQFDPFLLERHYIEAGESLFCRKPREDAPSLIIAYIMQSCDSLNPDGTTKPSLETRNSFSHAQKLRAAATFAFGKMYGLGTTPWHTSEATERMVGNPSCSMLVSSYMVSLHRRKVQEGDAPTSSRAITDDLLLQMYHFNHHSAAWDTEAYNRMRAAHLHNLSTGLEQGHPDYLEVAPKRYEWGGPCTLRMLWAVYTLSFLCLLRSDEVLKIHMDHLEFSEDGRTITLRLPFRKTAQFGGIKPFVLHWLDEEDAHLCPVRAITEWCTISGIYSGYLFPKITNTDKVSLAEDKNDTMTSESFLELFRHNLVDLDKPPFLYGTHSFRRGGVQYLSSVVRWGLRAICEWGGWSTEFSSLTIVKYLISWNDEPLIPRNEFLNPNRAPALKCYLCGRSCHCA